MAAPCYNCRMRLYAALALRRGSASERKAPAYARQRVAHPVGSRFRGNDVDPGRTWRRGLRPVYGACAPNGFPPTQE